MHPAGATTPIAGQAAASPVPKISSRFDETHEDARRCVAVQTLPRWPG
jgi:hypothetical protein